MAKNKLNLNLILLIISFVSLFVILFIIFNNNSSKKNENFRFFNICNIYPSLCLNFNIFKPVKKITKNGPFRFFRRCGPSYDWTVDIYLPETRSTSNNSLVFWGIGTGMWKSGYESFAKKLASNYNTIVVVADFQPGCPAKSYEAYVNTLNWVLDNYSSWNETRNNTINLSKVYAGGHSAAGTHAIRYMRDYPNKVNGVVTFDPVNDGTFGNTINNSKKVIIAGPSANPVTCDDPLSDNDVTEQRNGQYFYNSLQQKTKYYKFGNNIDHNNIYDDPVICGFSNNTSPNDKIPIDTAKIFNHEINNLSGNVSTTNPFSKYTKN